MTTRRKLTVTLLLALALGVASCAGQPPPTAPDTAPRGGGLCRHRTRRPGALQDGERVLVCDTAGALAPPLCVTQANHRRIVGMSLRRRSTSTSP